MKGAVKWMAGNHVAANMLMMFFLIGGLLIGSRIKQEVFPEFELDQVLIRVVYPGASPEEVEDGIIRPIEHAISGVNNVKRVNAVAAESVGSVNVEIIEGVNTDAVLNDIKAAIDRIITFPVDAEEPLVSRIVRRRKVISLVVYGDVTEKAIFEQAEMIRDDLLDKPDITQADIIAVRPLEISIEISEAKLREYKLTLSRVAGIIRKSSLDLPGGSLKTIGGEVLIHTNMRRYTGGEFDSVAVFYQPNGSRVTLGDIAIIKDGFAEANLEAKFDGKRAAMIDVYRVGKQTPKGISKTVQKYIAQHTLELPPTIKMDVWDDNSVLLQQRFELLMRNGLLGFVLVLIVLALFLEIRLAFWVAMGAAISFIGSLLLLPAMGVSINMISLFAFLVVIGIVVDDAIIVGENIFVHYRRGKPLKQAAIEGTWEVMNSVVFAILTTVAAFSPLLFVAGTMGNFMGVIPAIVISVLIISLIETLFILPSHLSGKFVSNQSPIWAKIERIRGRFDEKYISLMERGYATVLTKVVRNRYTTVAISIAVLLASIGLITGGFVKFTFMPRIDADNINVRLTMVPGTPFSETRDVITQIEKFGKEIVKEFDHKQHNESSDLLHSFTSIGSHIAGRSPNSAGDQLANNLAQISMLFKTSDIRTINLKELATEWRNRMGAITNIEKLTFQSDLMSRGNDIDIQLAHEEYDVLLQAVEVVKRELSQYDGIEDLNDNYSEGKREIKLRLKPDAASLGINETDLAIQVRSAYYGTEALRFLRGRNEVKVIVRYPEEDRQNIASVSDMRLRTPSGGEVPFEQAAYKLESRGYSVINRSDKRRVINVTANVNQRIASSGEVLAELKKGVLSQILYDFPGLSYDLEGDSRDRRESLGSLRVGFIIALFMIYALLAIPFGSFLQPLAVMSAIPFGIVGAIFGHLVMGFNLSMISMFGIVALSGIVVNDSLLMIDFINRARRDGSLSTKEAVISAGKRRFRPIVLTSLTTFFGLMPMILETSIQARFLIPMAVSLSFGVLFATGITLVLIPSLYLILEDLKQAVGGGE